MKTSLLLSAVIFLAGSFGALAQGTFRVQAPSTAQGVVWYTGATRSGPILSSDGPWQIEVLVNGTSKYSGALTLAGTSGRINNSSTIISLDGFFVGDTVPVVVRVWYGAATYSGAATGSVVGFGTSLPFSQTLGGTPRGGGAALPDPSMVNMLSFTVVNSVPEPSVMALAALGGGLFLLRRKAA
jgi:hypothetical protein